MGYSLQMKKHSENASWHAPPPFFPPPCFLNSGIIQFEHCSSFEKKENFGTVSILRTNLTYFQQTTPVCKVPRA